MSIFSSQNLVVFSGHVGKDPEHFFTDDGTEMASFSLAVGYWDYKAKKENTMWMKCVSFGKTAANVGKWVSSGARVEVVGELKEENWTDKQGVDRKTYSVNCRDFKVIKKGKGLVSEGSQNTGELDLDEADFSRPF